MSVKRYQLLDDAIDAATMDEVPHGEYVKHSDYAALEAECGRLREAMSEAFDFIKAQAPYFTTNGKPDLPYGALIAKIKEALARKDGA